MSDTSVTESWHESVHRIEEALSGLAYAMRQHDAVFYKERGSVYVIDVPKRTRSGKRDHRVYEEWTISKEKVELMSKDLDFGMPPLRFDPQPPQKRRPAPGKRWGGKR